MRYVCVLLGATLVFLSAGSGHLDAARSEQKTPGKRTSVAPSTASTSHAIAHTAAAKVSRETASAAAGEEEDVLTYYCFTCHNDQAKKGGLMLDRMDVHNIPAGAQTWEKVIRKLRGGMMPPLGMPQPSEDTRYQLISWLETNIDRAARAHPNPGRTALHRLNRTEYGNAIRDLLDLNVDVTDLLPADDEANGFDNIADVLKVSPSLLEQYLSASNQVASLAVGDPSINPISQVFRVPPDLSQEQHLPGLPLGTRGGILIHHNFPLDADYQFSVSLLQNIVGYVTGLEWPHQLEISIDGKRVFLAPVGGEADNKMSDANLGIAKDTLDARLKTKVHVSAGPHDVVVAFLHKNNSESDEPLEPFTRDLDLQNMNGVPLIDHVQITGPLNPTGPGDTPSRRRIFVCEPTSPSAEVPCARKILSTLARRAYRRPVTDADMETLLSFYQRGRNQANFDAGIENALRLILASPKFIFRAEPDPAGVAPDTNYRITDLELASRLSFFLWSSIPDDELINVAAQNKLHEPAVLDKEVRRMLADPKADSLVDNFADQWLFLRNLTTQTRDPELFPNFDDNLRQAFRTETELLFGSIIHEDRNVLDLLNANYTFVNQRLAEHYGIPNIYGSRFRRVALTDPNRFGLLGQGSILTVTSYPNRTSVVLRGKFIMDNIMGTPPPAPPPNVPALKENVAGTKQLSMRDLMAQHRKNPVCASCHKILDPLGFSLENFDATGRWRTKEAAGPIDASGQLADGTEVNGPVSLRKALEKHPEQFVRALTEKLLTYALGRGLEYYDMPTVRMIEEDSARHDYRFSTIVMGIVKSAPFEMRRAKTSETLSASAVQ
jgi:cytochrome c5